MQPITKFFTTRAVFLSWKTAARGLTLIEILLVLVVITVIMLMGVGQYQRYTQQRNIAAAEHAVQELFTYTNNVYQKHCVQLFQNMIEIKGSESGARFSCTDNSPIDPTTCYGLPDFINPLVVRNKKSYQVDQMVIAKQPSKLVVYLPVGAAIAQKSELFEKYKGILRPTKSVTQGGCEALGAGISTAAGDACFMWEGAPANYGTVATKTQANASGAMHLNLQQIEEEPSSDVWEQMQKDHYQLQRNNFGASRRCTLLEYKNMKGTLTKKDFENPK